MSAVAPVASHARQARTLFITGTDTGVGKTTVSVALLSAARAAGKRVAGYKPVASGAELTFVGFRNEDALALLDAMDDGADYDAVNPYCFLPPIAPHLAAREAGTEIETALLDKGHRRLATGRDLVIIEGAGGWYVPLSDTLTFADWVAEHQWPVVMVVAMRLGCLNHALLTAEAIARRTPLAGWIATLPPPKMDHVEENLDELRKRIAAPCWGVLKTDAETLSEDENGLSAWLATG
jgi:dethiobiotin synthetase